VREVVMDDWEQAIEHSVAVPFAVATRFLG
jgi:hypothetical protein